MNHKGLKILLLLASFAMSSEVYASCFAERGFSTVDISMNVGRVVVRPSDPVGTILRTATFPINPNGSTIYCNFFGGTIEAKLSKNRSESVLGDSIYTTNIQGIGIRLYRDAGDGSSFSGYYPYRKSLSSSTTYTLGEGFFVVEIVKTAAVTGSGALESGQYSNYRSTSDIGYPFLTSTVYGNAITIASSSCELQGDINQMVPLPTVNQSDFQGIGSSQASQNFNVNLLCNGGENLSGYPESNDISVRFGYTAADNTNNVITNSAPAATRATGVGIQMSANYNNTHTVIASNDKLPLGTLNSNQTLQYNVPLTASYYQTEAIVTPGAVNAIATVTIEYD